MHFRCYCIIVIAAFIISDPPAYSQPKPGDLKTAAELVTTGKADQALVLLDPIIERAMAKEAKDPKAICPGEAAAFMQQFLKGNVIVSVENDWCEAMLIRAYALNELKRSAEAEQVLSTLVGHSPANPQYLVEYAYTVRLNGRLDQSLSLYKEAEGVSAKLSNRARAAHWRAVALRGQGYAYIEMKRWDDATKAYERSFKYEPDNEIARNELLYIKQNRPR